MSRADAIATILRQDGLPDRFNRWLPRPAAEQETKTMISITARNAARLTPTAATIAAAAALTPIAAAPTAPGNPRLTIACPSCGQPAGAWCRSGTGRKLPDLHAARRPGPSLPIPSAAPAASPKESTVTKTSKKTSAKARQAAPAAKGAASPQKPAKGASGDQKAIRPGSKLEAIVALLRRPQGCTTADVLKSTDWPTVSMPQQAKAAGLTLKKEKKDGVTVYRAA